MQYGFTPENKVGSWANGWNFNNGKFLPASGMRSVADGQLRESGDVYKRQGYGTGYDFLATRKSDRKWGYVADPVWISAFSVVGGDDENLILQKGLHDPKNLKGDICR